jgi:hypothetical protein
MASEVKCVVKEKGIFSTPDPKPDSLGREFYDND